jgi:CelD/BcsL family acetyltransferase involved in cellulose biosynthesis
MAVWNKVQRETPIYQSPYLSPWFTKAVSNVRDDVFVTIIEDSGKPIGFFPFQRQGSRGVPVAGGLNDCQAVVVSPMAQWSPVGLLSGSRLRLWDFDHLLADQAPFKPFANLVESSPIIELSKGFDAYLLQKKTNGSNRISQTQRKWRKLLREQKNHASVRFEALSKDGSALAQVIEWKIQHCERTGTYPYLKEGWAVELLERLLQQDSPSCSGALSVLWVGDRIAAAHFGIKSTKVWHWWFPTYSEEWSKYSPGAILLLSLCEHVADMSLSQSVIDLGKGKDAYKSSFANGSYLLLEGYISQCSTYAMVRSLKRASMDWARNSEILEPARRVRKKMKRKQS